MGYLSSSVKIQPSGLYKATITYAGWVWNWDETATFKTISECEEWLLTKRCYKHTRDVEIKRKVDEKKKMVDEVEKLARKQLKELEEAVEQVEPEDIKPETKYGYHSKKSQTSRKKKELNPWKGGGGTVYDSLRIAH